MPTALAIASVDPPSKPWAANSTRAAPRISSRRSSALLRWVVVAIGVLLAITHLLVKSLLKERHSAGQADRNPALLSGEAAKGLGRVDVVGDQHAARAHGGPGRVELEPHAVEGVLAVVHERVDRPQAAEQRRQLVLALPG